MLPIERDNDGWSKVNYQFFKGGFDWYNHNIPDWGRWYYKYYMCEDEKRSCLSVAWYRRRSKVTNWLRNIEKFEEIKEKYEKEDLDLNK